MATVLDSAGLLEYMYYIIFSFLFGTNFKLTISYKNNTRNSCILYLDLLIVTILSYLLYYLPTFFSSIVFSPIFSLSLCNFLFPLNQLRISYGSLPLNASMKSRDILLHRHSIVVNFMKLCWFSLLFIIAFFFNWSDVFVAFPPHQYRVQFGLM